MMRRAKAFRLLLIEDNDDQAILISRRLLREIPDARLNRAACFGEALRLLEGEPCDLALLDLGLPDMDGIGGVERLVAMNVPVVVLTADSREGVACAALRAGAEDFVVKDEIIGLRFSRLISLAIERARMGRALQERHEALEAVVHALGHEMSAPPRQIRFLLGQAMTGGAMDDHACGMIAEADAAAENMQRLVSASLTLARLSIAPVDLINHDMARLTHEAIAAYGETALSRVAVLGGGSAPMDAALVLIALRNMIDNALRYSDPDSSVTVSLVGHPAACIVVENAAADFDPARAPRLFAPGYRGLRADAVDHPPGTGFGLAIIRRIARMHNGDATMSSPGRGRVSVCLALC